MATLLQEGMNKREALKEELLLERNCYAFGCEGVRFRDHICIGGLHLHEAIFSRKDIMKVKGKARDYYWDPRNCAILCSNFHTDHGHTRAFKEWWLDYAQKYNTKEHGSVQDFINGADLKVKA